MPLNHTFNGEYTAEVVAHTERIPLETTEGPQQWEDQITSTEVTSLTIAGIPYDAVDFRESPVFWSPILEAICAEACDGGYFD